MIKEVALTIGGGNGPAFHVGTPSQITGLTNLSLSYLIQFALRLAFFAAILLTLVFFLLGGFKWMLSQGDKKQVEEAQKTITFAVVGLIVVFLAMLIINLIGYLFRIPLL